MNLLFFLGKRAILCRYRNVLQKKIPFLGKYFDRYFVSLPFVLVAKRVKQHVSSVV